VEKVAKTWASFVNFKQLPKVNSHPLGEKFAQSGHPGFNAALLVHLFCLVYLDRPLKKFLRQNFGRNLGSCH
jgi:hypothetical protein